MDTTPQSASLSERIAQRFYEVREHRLFVVSMVGVLLLLLGVSWWHGRPKSQPLSTDSIPLVSASGSEVSVGREAPSSSHKEAETASIVIHVAGAVSSPGIVELPGGSRVVDAVDAAGGPTEKAEIHRLNLAQKLDDGMSILVPEKGQQVEPPLVKQATGDSSGNGSGGQTATGDDAGGQTSVNINTATVDELQTLKGVGPATAAAIIAWREDHGLFVKVEDLLSVPGIGPSKLAQMRDNVIV